MRRHLTLENILAYGMGIAVLVLIGTMRTPFWTLLPAILIGSVGVFLLMLLINLFRFPFLRRVNGTARRLKAGEADAVIVELSDARLGGDRSPETTILLSAAYSYQGRGIEGEVLALEARAAVQVRGACQKRDTGSRFLCEMAALVLYDAWVTQGRCAEAAHMLRERISGALQGNFMTVFVAWGFFLAGDDYNTRVVLSHVRPVVGLFNRANRITPKFRLMLAYMQYATLGQDTRREMQAFRGQLADWDAEAGRNAAAPYGARLREILDELRPLLEGG